MFSTYIIASCYIVIGDRFLRTHVMEKDRKMEKGFFFFPPKNLIVMTSEVVIV